MHETTPTPTTSAEGSAEPSAVPSEILTELENDFNPEISAEEIASMSSSERLGKVNRLRQIVIEGHQLPPEYVQLSLRYLRYERGARETSRRTTTKSTRGDKKATAKRVASLDEF